MLKICSMVSERSCGPSPYKLVFDIFLLVHGPHWEKTGSENLERLLYLQCTLWFWYFMPVTFRPYLLRFIFHFYLSHFICNRFTFHIFTVTIFHIISSFLWVFRLSEKGSSDLKRRCRRSALRQISPLCGTS